MGTGHDAGLPDGGPDPCVAGERHVDDPEALRRRMESLERENAYLRTVQRIEGRIGLFVGQFAFLVVAGRGLTVGIRNWMRTLHTTGQVSIPASAEVAAALVRRVFAMGLIGMIVTAVPISLLWRQNELIAEQNAYFRDQNQKIQDQLALEERNTRVARRAQLLSTLYDVGPCKPDVLCPPLANVRSRAEALLVFTQVERARGVRRVDLSRASLDGAALAGSDLREVRLDGASLRAADLTGADLEGASLVESVLAQARLQGARLVGADAQGADLREARLNEAADLSSAMLAGADLRDAWLRTARLDGADLSDAVLARADIFHASLRAARLEGADLSEVRNLHAADLTGVSYDTRTRWPPGFTPGAAR